MGETEMTTGVIITYWVVTSQKDNITCSNVTHVMLRDKSGYLLTKNFCTLLHAVMSTAIKRHILRGCTSMRWLLLQKKGKKKIWEGLDLTAKCHHVMLV